MSSYPTPATPTTGGGVSSCSTHPKMPPASDPARCVFTDTQPTPPSKRQVHVIKCACGIEHFGTLRALATLGGRCDQCGAALPPPTLRPQRGGGAS